MWTAAEAAMASTETAEAGVEAGEAIVDCLLGSPADKERPAAAHEPAEESEQFQEEIRTLIRSEATGPLELEDSGSRSSCFTALLGLVSLHGITTPGGGRAPISTATSSTFTPLLYSSTPDPPFLRPDEAVFVAAEAAVFEVKPGHGPLTGAPGSNAAAQPAGSELGEKAAVKERGQKRCAKRKEPEKKKSKGKSASPGSAGRKGKAGAVGRCQAGSDTETAAATVAAAAAAAVGDDVKSCGCEEVEANKEKVKLPYVHVRARRGQATDRHSLAERARREKINARMKLLQDLVPGCNKVSGTALVLEEIINHVQTLQRQVEILSMRLAAVNPRFDLSALDGFLDAADALAMMDLPNDAWGFEVPAMLSRQEGLLWQHLLHLPQQHQVEGDAMIAPQHHHHQQQQLLQVASTSEWARPRDVHLLHRHGLLRYESSHPAPLPPNHVKAEL